MVELRQVAQREVCVWDDGVAVARAAWEWETLCWGRETVKVARLTCWEGAAQYRPGLRSYLAFLWQPDGVAAVRRTDGSLHWFSKALEQSWQRWQQR